MSSSTLTEAELQFIRDAARFFENPSLFSKSLNWLGVPLEYAQSKLPRGARSLITHASKLAIEKALQVSLQTLPSKWTAQSFTEADARSKKSGMLHTGAATLLGGVGGFFGMASLPIELPITTVLILRSIADVAQQHGLDLNDDRIRLECLYIFSLGGPSKRDDAMDSAYYTSRLLFGEMIKNVVHTKSAPLLMRLVAQIAAQFEIRVTKKMIAQAAPVVGAIGGAGINLLFTNFFHECARFHFGLKKLEQEKGYEQVRAAFSSS